MNRFVTDDPQTNTEVLFNLAYVKDKEVWIRGGGPDGEDCSLVNFTKQMCQNCSVCLVDDGFPEDKEQDLDFICDLFTECYMSGCPIGKAYFIAIHAAELRERLRMYENDSVDSSGSTEKKV